MTARTSITNVLTFVALFFLALTAAEGALSVNIDDTGGNTTVNVSGKMNSNALYFARLSFENSPGGDAGMLPSQGSLQVGPQNGAGNQGDFYRITGPTSFGSDVATYYSGYRGREQTIAIRGAEGRLFLDNLSQVFNITQITNVYPGKTIAALGLTPGIYTWLTDGGVGHPTDSITLVIGVPLAPVVSAVPSTQSVQLSWTVPQDNGSPITGYQIKYRLPGGTWQSVPFSGTGTSTTLSGLNSSTNYEFGVTAVNARGPGQLGTVQTSTLPQPAGSGPTAPGNITATPGISSVTVGFTPSTGSGPISYTAACFSSSVTPNSVVALTGSASPLVLTGAIAGASYYCNVDASNSSGTTAGVVTPYTVIPTYDAPQVTAAPGLASAILNWSPIAGATGYQVQYRLQGTSSWITWPFTGTGTTTTINGLIPGSLYEFSIAAQNNLVTPSYTGPQGLATVGIPSIAPSTQTISATVGTPITQTTPYTATNFTPTIYGITPPLPSGLTMNQVNGAIFGTATTVQALTSYTVRAEGGASGAALATVSISVTQAAQSITFGPVPTPTYSPSGSFNVFASASSGLPVTYSTSSSTCSVNANTGVVTILSGGTCLIAANQSGNANYSPAPTVTQTITIVKAQPAALTLVAASTNIQSATSTTLSVTGGIIGSTVNYSLLSGPCGLTNNVLTGNTSGTCIVSASEAGNTNYEAITSNQVAVGVAIGQQAALTLTVGSTTINANGSTSLTTSGGSGTGAISYQTTGPCSVSGSVLTATGEGSCQVTAFKGGTNGQYADATSLPVLVTILRATSPPLILTASPTTIGFDGTSTLSTTGGIVIGPVSYGVSGTGRCYINANQLIGTQVGTCTVTASQAQTSVYSAVISNTVTITVKERSTTLSYPHAIATIGIPFTLAPITQGLSGATFDFLYGNLPLGLTVNPQTGVISGTPLNGPTIAYGGVVSAYKDNAYDAAVTDITLVTPQPSPAPIPTLGTWARLFMMLMIGIAGAGYTRSKKRSSH
ncbi:MAG: hypothetical protein EBQ73_05820 [Gammaproteobacteria bacterium]|nr:hypothetical protein [Gammaproteobacteria bacterium]